MRTLTHLTSRIFNTPLAIRPEKLEVILAVLGDRIGIEVDASTLAAAKATGKVERKGYSVTQEGIAIIPIQGTLMKSASGLWADSGISTYEAIAEQFEDAYTSSNVKGILLDIDSPGGETHGLFDLADMIFGARGSKPIYAVSNDSAYSAAYAIASSADKIFVTRTGGVGSVGVYCCHADYSKADEKAGIKYTYIQAGEKKTEGNPHEPLSKSALADIQGEIDREYQMFVSLVARNRSKSFDAIKATEAACFYAENSVPLLADYIGTFDDALAEITALVTGSQVLDFNISPQSAMKALTSITSAVATTLNTFATNEDKTRMAKTLKADATTAETELKALLAEDDTTVADETEETKCSTEDDEDEKDEAAKATSADESDEDEKDEDQTKASAITQMVNLCAIAGKPELAATFINKGYSVKQVQNALMEQRSLKSNQTKVKNMNTETTSAVDQFVGASKTMTAKEYEKFLMKNGNLYKSYLSDRNAACSTEAGAEKYIAEMNAKLISARG